MKKKAIVLCGVSGVGKTHYREDPENHISHLPAMDIAEVYRAHRADFPDYPLDWQSATEQLLKMVDLAFELMEGMSSWSPPYTVVIEGYFLPGTPSRRMLVRGLRIMGVEIEFKELWAPYDVCLERLQAQLDSGEGSAAEIRGRMDLLQKCWRPQHA